MGGSEPSGLDGPSARPFVPGGECFESLFGGVVSGEVSVEVEGVTGGIAAALDAVSLAERLGVGVDRRCGRRFDALQLVGGGVELSGDGVELAAELAASPHRGGGEFSLYPGLFPAGVLCRGSWLR